MNVTPTGEWTFQDCLLSLSNRRFFVIFNDVSAAKTQRCTTLTATIAALVATSTIQRRVRVVTQVQVRETDAANGAATRAKVHAVVTACVGKHKDTFAIASFGPAFQKSIFDNERFNDILAESNSIGPVYQIQKRISQHLCAPILNPNARIGCTSPLNYETMPAA